MDRTDIAAFESLIGTTSLPALGPHPRHEALDLAELNHRLDQFFAPRSVPPRRQQAARAAALLWHDHLDASHRISQDLHDPTGSFLHGIMHRREPDYSNAKYWFRHTGRHPAFPEIAQHVAHLAHTRPEAASVGTRLVRSGEWDPLAFVDLCEEAASAPETSPRYRLVQEVQALEWRALLPHVLGMVS